MARSSGFGKQILKFVLLFASLLKFSCTVSLLQIKLHHTSANGTLIERNGSNFPVVPKHGHNNGTGQSCCGPLHVPSFIIEMYKKMIKNPRFSGQKKSTIRSFPGKRLPWTRPTVHFNLTTLKKSAMILKGAFFMLAKPAQTKLQQDMKVVIYDIFTGDKLSSRVLLSNESGWVPFELRSVKTVKCWLSEPRRNHGIELRFSVRAKKVDYATAAKRISCINKPWLSIHYYDKGSTVSDFEKRVSATMNQLPPTSGGQI